MTQTRIDAFVNYPPTPKAIYGFYATCIKK